MHMSRAKRPLLLVGAGGFGREVVEVVHALNKDHAQFDLLGFLDDAPRLQGASVGQVPVLGPIEAIEHHPEAAIVVTVGSPKNYLVRQEIVGRLALPEERYATLVHPAASVGRSTTIGAGTVVEAGAVATVHVCVGAHVTVMPGVTLTHDDVVEDFAIIASGVQLAGGVRVGRGAYLGSGCLVREQVTIGPEALVAMGAVVVTDIGRREVWQGVPARRAGSVVPPTST
jgi:sugar O-acyltransferase (sialic acid O-acetyltransferase NeuD family)